MSGRDATRRDVTQLTSYRGTMQRDGPVLIGMHQIAATVRDEENEHVRPTRLDRSED